MTTHESTTEATTIVTSNHEPAVLNRSRSLFRGVQSVWYILGFLEALLAFRFVLRFLGANPAAGFSELVYAISFPFVAPFQAVFQSSGVSEYVFEWTTLLAMAVYWLLAWGIIKLLAMGRPVSRTEAHQQLQHQDI